MTKTIKKIVIAIFLIVFCIMYLGCDLLSPREAEKPNKGISNWEQPTTPQVLVNNFKIAIGTRAGENYIMCFIDTNLIKKSYRFNPTYESYIKYPSIFNGWNLFSEKIFFDNFKSKFPETTSIIFTLTKENYTTIQNDSITYSAGYKIEIDHNLSGFPKEFRGNLEFTLYRNIGGLWAIGLWSDYLSDENYPTWSQLKGSLSY